MLNINLKKDEKNNAYLETTLSGKALLAIAQLNKGTAFTQQERIDFDLIGKLPAHVETLSEQVNRAYHQFLSYNSPINRNIFLNQILNNNHVLFYKLVSDYLEEMLPTIYTPIVANAVQQFHLKFLQPRGLYITYEDLAHIDAILDNRSNPDVQLIVATDGEGVLGIGDQGIGAMMIPIAKLMVYTAIGKINPLTTLPIMLDLGTNNQALLESPFYLGSRHERISGKQYDEFMDVVVNAFKKKFPQAFVHWEDFGKNNADRYLKRYRDVVCSFNDDIQGTGVVAVAAILAAIRRTEQPLEEQRIVIYGAGTAGMGIVHQIYKTLRRLGLSEAEARRRFWLLDSRGLVTEHLTVTTETHKPYIRTLADIENWDISDTAKINLFDTVRHVKPTILIGSSAVAGSFSEAIIKEMAAHVEQPIIFPLSNPTERSEAAPADLLTWTNGKALIATGSPFDPVDYNNETVIISQCNNFLAFPGLGLGVLAVKATRVSSNMLWAASEVLSEYTRFQPHTLLPNIHQSIDASRQVAIAVAKAAIRDGLTTITDEAQVDGLIDAIRWEPHYVPYKRSA